MSPGTTPAAFWGKVNKTTECWIFLGAKTKQGYGRQSVFGKAWLAHRYAYAISKGAIPGGMQVLHKCDNPSCVKPWHLFLGTQQDNMDDMVRKGRHRGSGLLGESHGRSKISKEDVIKIRNRRANNRETYGSIAEDYPISGVGIRNICVRKNWKHII